MYFLSYCLVPTPRRTYLIVDAPSAVRAWVNGRTVILEEENPEAEGAPVHAESDFFELPAGTSVVVVAAATGKGDVGIRMPTEDGMATMKDAT